MGPDDNETIPVADRVAGQLFVDLVGQEVRMYPEHLPDIGRLLELAEVAWQGSNAFMFARSQKDDAA